MKKPLDIRKFVKWDEYTAYMYGYILGDGCLTAQRICKINGINRVKKPYIDVASKDFEYLRELALQLSPKIKVVDDVKRKGDKVYHTGRFGFTSDDWTLNLEALGLCPNKSNIGCTIELPEDPIYFTHFIRGLFDSDGCVTSHHGNESKSLRVYLMGHSSYITQISERLPQFNLKQVRVCELQMCKRDLCKDFYNLLYLNATIFLKRKKLRYEELLNN